MKGRCHNLTLSVAAIDHNAFKLRHVLSTEGNSTIIGLKGRDFQILEALSRKLRFQYRLSTPSNGQWGFCDQNMPGNPCSGLIGMVARNEVDVGISTVTPTPERGRFVDFSFPYAYDEITFVTKEPESRDLVDDLFFTKPFQVQVWIFLATCLLVFAILIKISHRFKRLEPRHFGTGDIFSVLVRQNLPLKPLIEKPSSWMVIFTLILVAGCSTKIYECMLTSSASAAPVTTPINTVEDMVEAVMNDNYVISAREGTADQQTIMFSPNSFMRAFTFSSVDLDFPKTILEGLEMVLESEKYAFVAPRAQLKAIALENNVTSRIHFAKEALFDDMISVVFRPAYPCRNVINYWLRHFASSGLLLKWDKPDLKLLSWKEEKRQRIYMEVKYFALGELRLIFAFLGAAWIISLVTWLGQTILELYRSK